MNPEALLLWALAAPLLGALGVSLCGRWPNLRETVTLTATLCTFGCVLGLLQYVLDGQAVEVVLLEVFAGIPLAFNIEPLGMLYALVASGLWIPTAIYGIGYMRGHGEQNQTRFFTCFALAIFAALGIAFAGNLLTLFLFYEVLTFSTYPLVTHYGNDEARKAGRIYLGNLIFTSVAFLLLAVVTTWWMTGTLDFRPGGILAGNVEGPMVAVLLGLFAFGAGKAALMPFHRWLPAAMVAPTPVSALLHAVAIVKAGVFTILKVIVYIFGIDFLSMKGASIWLMYAASFT
ncbi:MAG: proton-conducting transporter membrane subunit, partial [Planctomycetota bacterium]|nr:proton-conducting transporter membrane subunit [Planctomycetota bacterium]